MSDIQYCFIGDDPELQREAVDLLARCFTVWAERKITFKGRFPFREHSFIARNPAGETVGHLGIIPFEIQNANGDWIAMAGVASVAVLPEWRMKGIAGKLCEEAARHAEKCNFAAMPLYTAAVRVYEKSGWQIVPSGAKLLKNPSASGDPGWRDGSSLSENEREFIINCYQNMPPLTGRVKRTFDAYDAVSWQRLFSKPCHRWQLNDSGYILSVDGTIGEGCGDWKNIPGGCETALISENDPFYTALINSGWSDITAAHQLPPCWDGETVMLKTLQENLTPGNIFFPLANKF